MQPQHFMDQKYAEIQSIINKNSTAIYSTGTDEMSPGGEPATVVMSEQNLSDYPNLRAKGDPSFITNNNIGSLMSGVINH